MFAMLSWSAGSAAVSRGARGPRRSAAVARPPDRGVMGRFCHIELLETIYEYLYLSDAPERAPHVHTRASLVLGFSHHSVQIYTEERYRNSILGVKQKGRKCEGPFNHATGRGYVKA